MKVRKCPNGHYTTKPVCHCGEKTKSAHPAKFSEKYGKYRRAAKEGSKEGTPAGSDGGQ